MLLLAIPLLISPPPCMMLSHFSHVRLFATVWTVARQASSAYGILEWVTMPSSRGSSPPRDQTQTLMSPVLVGRFFTTGTTWGIILITFIYTYKCFSSKLAYYIIFYSNDFLLKLFSPGCLWVRGFCFCKCSLWNISMYVYYVFH